MSGNPTCATCRWWDATEDDYDDLAKGFSAEAPCCIRSTPGAFPSRDSEERCGEHESKPRVKSKRPARRKDTPDAPR